MLKIFTIGTNKKSAKMFFEILEKNKVKGIIDIRLNNNSQLNGFTKGKDLEFFLKKINNIDYVYLPELAPTKEILNGYKKKEINWETYVEKYLKLLDTRKTYDEIDIEQYNNYCFLCSEEVPDNCHRRLVAEYFSKKINMKIKHL